MSKDIKMKSLLKGFAFACIAVQLLCLALFCLGIASYYGKTITVIEGVNLILSIFSIGSSFYRNILGTVLGVIYAVCLILLIKDTIFTCKHAKELSKLNDQTKAHVFEIAQSTGNGIFRLLLFMIACSMVKAFPLNFAAKLVVFLAIALFIGSRVILYLLQRCVFQDLIWQTVYMLIFCLSLTFFISYARTPAIEDVIIEIQALFKVLKVDSSYFMSAISALAIPVLYGVLLIISLVYVYSTFNDFAYYQKIREFKNPLALVVLSSVLCGIVLLSAFSQGISADVQNIFSLLKGYLPLLFTSIAFFLSTGFPQQIHVHKKKEAVAEEAPTPTPAPASASVAPVVEEDATEAETETEEITVTIEE